MDALRLDRFVPALRAVGLRPLHEIGEFERAAAAHEAVAAFAAEREFDGFADALLGGPGRDGAVAREEGAERAAFEFDERGGAVFDREAGAGGWR